METFRIDPVSSYTEDRRTRHCNFESVPAHTAEISLIWRGAIPTYLSPEDSIARTGVQVLGVSGQRSLESYKMVTCSDILGRSARRCAVTALYIPTAPL